MLDCLHLPHARTRESSRLILESLSKGLTEGELCGIISEFPSLRNRVCVMTMLYLEGAILSNVIFPIYGSVSMVRALLILERLVVAMDLLATWLLTWPKLLLADIAILWGGFGEASSRVGKALKALVKKWVGHIIGF